MPEFTLSVPVQPGDEVRVKGSRLRWVLVSMTVLAPTVIQAHVVDPEAPNTGRSLTVSLDDLTIVPPAPEGLEWVGCSQAPEHCLMARQDSRTWHANKEGLFLRIGDALLEKWGSAGNQEANQTLATEIELVTARHRREKDA